MNDLMYIHLTPDPDSDSNGRLGQKREPQQTISSIMTMITTSLNLK